MHHVYNALDIKPNIYDAQHAMPMPTNNATNTMQPHMMPEIRCPAYDSSIVFYLN